MEATHIAVKEVDQCAPVVESRDQPRTSASVGAPGDRVTYPDEAAIVPGDETNCLKYAFTIESIKKTKCWINGIQTHLDYPTPALFQRKAYSISFKGWVTSLYEEIDDVCLTWLGSQIVSAQIFARVDVQQAYPESENVVGFELNVVPIVCGGDEPLLVILTTKDGRSSPLFEIYLRFDQGKVQREIAASKPPTFALIVSGGRCGSTLLAQLLLRNSVVLGYDKYPYEAHIARHLSMKWFSELQPAHFLSTDKRESADQGLSAIHSILVNCVGDTQQIDAMAALTELSRQQRSDYIKRLYQMLSPQKAASVILEKIDSFEGLSFWLIREMFPNFRPIFLIRDPRDQILSIRNFNEKRGNYMFHEAKVQRNVGPVQLFAAHLSGLAWFYDHFAGDKILVKYEDLVRKTPEVMKRVCDFLAIDDAPHETARFLGENPARDQHVTSSSPEASIGRWRRELSESQKEAMNWVLQPFINRFGY